MGKPKSRRYRELAALFKQAADSSSAVETKRILDKIRRLEQEDLESGRRIKEAV